MIETSADNARLADPHERLAYTVVEASRALGVSDYKIRSMIATGELPYAKLNGRTLIRKVDLEAVLEAALVRGRP